MWKWSLAFITFVGYFAFLLFPGGYAEAHAASGQRSTICPSLAPARLAETSTGKQRQMNHTQVPLCSRSALQTRFVHPKSVRSSPRSPLTALHKALPPRSGVAKARPAFSTVKPGESLWSLAARLYGSGWQWQRLYQTNKAAIGNNPRLMYPGQRLALP